MDELNYDEYITMTGERITRDDYAMQKRSGSTITIFEIEKFLKWTHMQRPFAIGDVVRVTSGYHTGREGEIVGVHKDRLWCLVKLDNGTKRYETLTERIIELIGSSA